MKYCSCKICNAVTESTAQWRAGGDMVEHIKEEHPEIVKEMEIYEEERQVELAKIKPAKAFGDYMIWEDLPKKEGRIEHEGRIINLKD